MIIDSSRKEIIQAFMDEAKRKHDIRSGFKSVYTEAIGLFEVCVAFEAFINELLYNPSIRRKRINFSSHYKNKLIEHLDALKKWIIPLKDELEGNPLIDMTPNSRNPPLDIDLLENLERIIEVVYRVRCNLVHGSKSLESSRNKLLISNSFHFLYVFMDILLKEEKIL